MASFLDMGSFLAGKIASMHWIVNLAQKLPERVELPGLGRVGGCVETRRRPRSRLLLRGWIAARGGVPHFVAYRAKKASFVPVEGRSAEGGP